MSDRTDIAQQLNQKIKELKHQLDLYNITDNCESHLPNDATSEKINLGSKETFEMLFDLLRKDFLRFCDQHSWYKHLPFDGETFYFYLGKGQQARNGIHPEIKDYDGSHWHFLQRKQKLCGQVTFGPFLRGDSRGYHIIIKNYTKEKFDEWLKMNYPEHFSIYQESMALDPFIRSFVLSNLFEVIAKAEQNKHWESLVVSFVNSYGHE